MIDDIVSDVLHNVRLSGAIFFEVDAVAPWVAAAPPSRDIAAAVMRAGQHVIEYHVLVEGVCWARVTGPDEPAIELAPGSVVAFPHGDTHVLASEPHLDAEPDLSNFDAAKRARSLPFHVDHRDGANLGTARLICGFLGCDAAPFNPLLASLPRVIHTPDGYTSGDGFLGHLINAAVRETETKRTGSAGILAKLSELIFIEVVRRYAEVVSDEQGGWLCGLRDPGVGRAIRLMHSDPARPWTIAVLAREAGMSRTVLAEHFTDLLGMPPMTYLANWRMQRAAGLLSAESAPIIQIAEQVGYESEAGFSRAFKRATGLSPAHWRRRAEK